MRDYNLKCDFVVEELANFLIMVYILTDAITLRIEFAGVHRHRYRSFLLCFYNVVMPSIYEYVCLLNIDF